MIKLDLPTEKEFLGMIDDGIIKSIQYADYNYIFMTNALKRFYYEHNAIWLKNGKIITYYNNEFEVIGNNIMGKKCASIMPVIRDKSIISSINQTDDIVYLYQYYPLLAADPKIQKELEGSYTTSDKVPSAHFYEYPVYFYKGKFYIKIEPLYGHIFIKKIFSNGKEYNMNFPIWIEVINIPWIIDRKRNLLISKYPLESNMPFYIDRQNNIASTHEMLKRISGAMADYDLTDIVFERLRLVDNYKKEQLKKMVSDDTILQMLMNKENITTDDLEMIGENIVLRR